MSLLAPLYALGALAIGLPILFHLIRRRPRGELLFSSLLFLSPSPPRITKRSRVSDWLLLLLRATAVLLLALAFCRPFLRTLGQLMTSEPQRRVVILLDRSASMRRADLWNQALDVARSIHHQRAAGDRLGLVSFDDKAHVEMSLSERAADVAANERLLRKLAGLQPGWGGTDLGNALREALERLQTGTNASGEGGSSIVLISDLQEGSRLDALQSITWPPDVTLDVRPVRTDSSNATVRWLPTNDDDGNAELRARVSNFGPSTTDVFKLAWRDEATRDLDAPVKTIQVASGRSRVVTVPHDGNQKELVLLGDAHEFDNVAFKARADVVEKRLLFVGDDSEGRGRQLFFLSRTSLGSIRHPVRVEAYGNTETPPADLDNLDTPLVVVARPLSDRWVAALKSFLTRGGRVLIVMDPNEYTDVSIGTNSQMLSALLDVNSCSAQVVKPTEYAIVSDVDFQNPLFQPFADARFNDFTKIRFWQYYRLTTDHEQPWSVLARFEDGAPALVEKSFGPGRMWILTTGWSPDSSQLARSSKFVPLLVTILGDSIETNEPIQGFSAGQTIDLSKRTPFSRVVDPIGQTITIAVGDRQFDSTDHVGIYRFESNERNWEIAVNLDPAESQTVPMDVAELERRGVRMGRFESADTRQRRQRQLRDIELEGRQKLWRWLVVAALSVLAVETYVAGRVRQRTFSWNDKG